MTTNGKLCSFIVIISVSSVMVVHWLFTQWSHSQHRTTTLYTITSSTTNRQQQQQLVDLASSSITTTTSAAVSTTQQNQLHSVSDVMLEPEADTGEEKVIELRDVMQQTEPPPPSAAAVAVAATTTTTITPIVSQQNRKTYLEQVVSEQLSQLDLHQPINIRHARGQWQMAEDSREIYVMSAYYDNRVQLDQPQVRVIGVAESDVTSICCLLWYNVADVPAVVEAQLIPIGPKISPDGRTVLEQFIFSCSVDSSKTIPVNVSLITPHNLQPSTLLPVNIPEKPASPSEMIEFGHCMSILYWKQDPFRLVEWLELHRLWGVGEINIYVHQVDNVTDSILRHYAAEKFVRYFNSPTPLDVDSSNEHAILVNMSPVINDCLYRNLYRYRHIICTDLDELIVPVKHSDYSQMLHAIKTQLGSFGPIHSFLFRNAYFFTDFGATTPEPWFLLTQRYTRRVRPSRYGYSSKSITRPLSCVGLQNHLCWKRLPRYNNDPNWNIDVNAKIAKNHHYKKCHFDKYLSKNGVCLKMMSRDSFIDNSMLRFGAKLSRTVLHKLIQLDIAETTNDTSWKKFNPVP